MSTDDSDVHIHLLMILRCSRCKESFWAESINDARNPNDCTISAND